MSSFKAGNPPGFPEFNVIDKRIDTRLRLSIKREFLVSKLNGLLPSKGKGQFHAYCVGIPRSGTHSIAHMLQPNYAAAHEPHAYYAIYHVLKRMNRQYTFADIQNVLKWRHKKFALDLEAAHYLHHVADVLAASFPNAKFILTVREPLSWLESEINRNYSTRNKLFWRELEDYRYGRYQHSFTPQETALEHLNLYPIASYLSYWKEHNQFVLKAVPEEQLLVMDTREIRPNPDKLADFLGIDVSTLNLSKSHANKRNKRFKLTDLVDSRYLYQQIDEICADFIDAQLPCLQHSVPRLCSSVG